MPALRQLTPVVLLSTPFIQPGFANTDSPKTDALEEVAVIASRTAQPLSDLSANISVLSKEELKRVNAQHIQQSLSHVPGVGLQRGNGQESLPSIRSAVLTGAGACGNVLVLEDGLAVRGAGFCNVNELFDTHFEQAARIEVVRGAGSVFYGSNALTGSINVVLPVEGEDSVALELGSYDYKRAKASIGYGEGDNQGRVYLTLTDTDAFRDTSDYQQQKFSWRHQSQFNNWQLNYGLTYTNLDQETAGFITGRDSYREKVLAKQNPNPEAFRKTRSLRAWIGFAKELSDSSQIDGKIYVRDTDMDFLLHFLPGDPLEQNQQTGFGWQSAWRYQATDDVKLTLGFDGDISDGALQQTQDAPTQGSAFLQATIPTGTHYDYEVDAIQLGLFAHADWQPHPQWQVTLGGRFESVDYDYDNLGLDGRSRDDGTACGFGGCRYSRPADREDDFNHFSPKLEVQYTVNGNWRLSAAVANSFRAPQATELYRLQRAQTVADLDIVEVDSIELTTRYDSDSLSAALSIYAMDTKNNIIRDSNFFNIDGQATKSQGVELSLRQQLSEQWSWRMAASYADHQYDSDQEIGGVNINGLQVDTAPKFFGSAFLNWQATEKINLEAELHHTAKYFLNPVNSSDYEGHTLVHLRGAMQVSEQLSVGLRIVNLTDKRYAERADFTSFTDERYFPGDPRSVFAEVKYRF